MTVTDGWQRFDPHYLGGTRRPVSTRWIWNRTAPPAVWKTSLNQMDHSNFLYKAFYISAWFIGHHNVESCPCKGGRLNSNRLYDSSTACLKVNASLSNDLRLTVMCLPSRIWLYSFSGTLLSYGCSKVSKVTDNGISFTSICDPVSA